MKRRLFVCLVMVLVLSVCDGWAAGDLELVNMFMGRRSAVSNAAVALHPSLAVAPQRKTVLPGESVDFEALGETTNITWFLLDNHSGASNVVTGVNTMTYIAGTNAGVVDVVEAWDGLNRFARSFVNVISPEEVAQLGKAVIIAGGKTFDDPVWLATDVLADKAFRVLRYRGFADDSIRYHSFDPTSENVDEPATVASISNTFTNWVAPADKLFVFMVDHGSDSQAGAGVFRLNSSNLLYATQVDNWLDDLQDANSNLQVTVMLDFCYSVSFLDELTYTEPGRRIVMASAEKLTHFMAGGLVSFADTFFNGILDGRSFYQAYVWARDAMNTYQDAGIYDDESVADGLILGASFIAGKDVPVIGKVLGPQLLSEGTTATLWADDVSGYYTINRVWCNVLSPSHAPATNSSQPVIDIPVLDLSYSNRVGRYESRYDGFSEAGNYKVVYYAKDIWDSVSLPRQSQVIQAGYDERIVIAAGGPTNRPHWTGTRNLARSVYRTARTRAFSTNHICFLSAAPYVDADSDGTNDVNDILSLATLEYAFTNWAASADKVTLFMLGDEDNESFVFDAVSELDVTDLDDLLDTFQASQNTTIVVMEFPESGIWLEDLTPPPDRDRIVMAATEEGRNYVSEDGLTSFTQFFLSGIFQGKTIGTAFESAEEFIYDASGSWRQTPLIDDDGDGDNNRRNDRRHAYGFFMGPAFVTGDDVPFIGRVMPETVTRSNEVRLWATDVLDVDGISNVWCVVSDPDFDGSKPQLRIDLTNNPATGEFEAMWDGFTLDGFYVLSFYAQDTLGELSAPVQTKVIVGNAFAQPDAFEVDDTAARARAYSRPQVHSLHQSNDVDWVRAYLAADGRYDIATIHHTDAIDTTLSLYREQNDGTLVEVTTVDDYDATRGELIRIANPAAGFYLVRVAASAGSASAGGGYSLVVEDRLADGRFAIQAINALTHGAMPAGTKVYIDDVLVTNFNGEVMLRLATSGDVSVRVEPPAGSGFVPTESLYTGGQAGNLQSHEHGNPRAAHVADVSFGMGALEAFQFWPVTWVSGSLRDSLTGAWAQGTELSFTVLDGLAAEVGKAYDRYPRDAQYGSGWQTLAGGRLPTNVMLFAGQTYRLDVSEPGYEPITRTDSLSNTVAGARVELGTLLLVPVDLDGNNVADAWELLHLGTNVVLGVDSDGDGHDDLTEYRLGTDPTNSADVLSLDIDVELTPKSLSGFTLRWPVEGGREYEVEAEFDLENGQWGSVFGPQTAVVEQAEMTWSDTNAPSLPNRNYRLSVGTP